MKEIIWKNSLYQPLIEVLFQSEKIQNCAYDLVYYHRVVNFVPLSDELLKIKNEQQKSSLLMCQELFKLNSLFKTNSVDAIFLKGPILSHKLYGDFTKKTYVDLDILIKIENLDLVIDLLNNNEYEIYGVSYNTPKQKEVLVKNNHHLTFYNENTKCFVEIHWKLTNSIFFKDNFQNQIWKNAKNLTFNKHQFMVLDDVDEFIFLCVHGSIHFFSRLYWLVDCFHFLEAKDENFVQNVLEKTQKNGASLPVYLCLSLLFDFSKNQKYALNKEKSKVEKLKRIVFYQLDNFQEQRSLKKGLVNYFLFYYAIFVLFGFKKIIEVWYKRSNKIENWQLYVFSDKLFFLNKMFYRPIWIWRKIRKK